MARAAGRRYGDRMISDAGEDAAKVPLRVESAELGSLDEGEDAGGTLAAFVRAGEEPVLASEGDRADAALGGVVVDLDAAVVEVSAQRRPAGERVADGLGDGALGRDTSEVCLEPSLQRLDLRCGLGGADALIESGGTDLLREAVLVDQVVIDSLFCRNTALYTAACCCGEWPCLRCPRHLFL